MAENKRSFILYADYYSLIKLLPDEKAGQLLKLIFSYVNDENPAVEDLTLQLAFEPIKQQLKRDLKAWESEKNWRSEAGRKGMQTRWGNKKDNNVTNVKKGNNNDNNVKNAITPITVNDTVTVTVNGTVNERYITPAEFLKENSPIDLEQMAMKSNLPPDEFEKAIEQWSLKAESMKWAYSEDKSADLKALKAGLQKWLNSWVENNRQKGDKGKKAGAKNNLDIHQKANRYFDEQ